VPVRQVSLLFPFCLALFAAAFASALLPPIKLLAFAPFLAILYNTVTRPTALWIALLCGLGVDLLSSELRLGLHALNYCLTTLLLFKHKRHFFDDKPLSLSLFTLLISAVSTLLQILLIALFEHTLPLSGQLLITDLVIMPLVDAIYAFLWFSCPIMLYLSIKKVQWRALWTRLLAYRFGIGKETP